MSNAANSGDSEQPTGVQRLDKWLYFARIAKSRTQAADLVNEGRVRVNRVKVGKPSQPLRTGEFVTIALRGRVLVLKVLAPGRRRGPAHEARALYEMLMPHSSGASNATPLAKSRNSSDELDDQK